MNLYGTHQTFSLHRSIRIELVIAFHRTSWLRFTFTCTESTSPRKSGSTCSSNLPSWRTDFFLAPVRKYNWGPSYPPSKSQETWWPSRLTPPHRTIYPKALHIDLIWYFTLYLDLGIYKSKYKIEHIPYNFFKLKFGLLMSLQYFLKPRYKYLKKNVALIGFLHGQHLWL